LTDNSTYYYIEEGLKAVNATNILQSIKVTDFDTQSFSFTQMIRINEKNQCHVLN